ncbi:hypothetical protein GGQ97_001552 [Sphingomonas kaistensis]|uniref:Uncharacterized protein n=1 Tax=Sphingomonas kaistensis TaxID=298708 RepID=A0A7X5Y5V1_9SPHN|nr:hypothetical protein [Sphingomonas kaistensis]NJC05759.1 hypothetical protein [Sphingomonas kaistensis]
MLSSIMSDVLLRQIPEHLVAGVRNGDLKVYGSIIRSLSEGRIVGHLQETAGLGNFALQALSTPAMLPLQGASIAADMVGHGVSYAQNEQIKAAVDVLQNMQVANLALSAAGIGVSVAGFAVIAAKIARVEQRVEALGDKLEALARSIETLRRDKILDDFSALRTAVEQMDEGWLLSQPEECWREVARQTHALSNVFQRRAEEMLEHGDFVGADPFLEALALASSTRIQARLASGDEVVARRAAEESASALVKLGREVQLGAAVLQAMNDEIEYAASPAWNEKLDAKADAFRSTVTTIRQREQSAAATCLTLGELERQRISGRTWLQAAREEQNAPLLCLLPTAA